MDKLINTIGSRNTSLMVNYLIFVDFLWSWNQLSSKIAFQIAVPHHFMDYIIIRYIYIVYDGYANTQFKSLLLKSFLYDGRVGMLKKNCPSTSAELFCEACTKFIFLFPFLHFGPMESNFWKFWWDESFGASSMYFTKQTILHCEFIELCRCRLRPASTGWLTVALMLDTERWLWTLGPGATLVWARVHGHHHHQAHHGISEVLQTVSPLLHRAFSWLKAPTSTFTFKTLC